MSTKTDQLHLSSEACEKIDARCVGLKAVAESRGPFSRYAEILLKLANDEEVSAQTQR